MISLFFKLVSNDNRTATRLSEHDLRPKLTDYRKRYPKLSDADDLFVLWFLRAFVTERDEHAAAALRGGSRDATALEEIHSAFIIFDARDPRLANERIPLQKRYRV